MRIVLLLLVPSCLLLVAACDRNTEAFVAGEKPRTPDLARIFPESDASATRPGAVMPAMPNAPARGNIPQARAPQVPAQPPAQAQPQVVAQASGAGDTISGTITVGPSLQVPPGGLLFVIARAAGVTAGPPMAVLRVAAPKFPLDFEIGPKNVMIPRMRFEGDIEITARVDGDGNAMTKLPGDLSGQTKGSHKPGAKGVSIVLDTKL